MTCKCLLVQSLIECLRNLTPSVRTFFLAAGKAWTARGCAAAAQAQGCHWPAVGCYYRRGERGGGAAQGGGE